MFALAIKLVLVLAVMFGGAGVTAAAAQSSLPSEALYPVKLLIEDLQLGLASTPDAQIDAQLDHAQQRVSEMMRLNERSAAIPADVPARLQTQLQVALHSAAQLDDQHLPAALDRIQLRTQDQLRAVERLHLDEAVRVLTQARAMAQLGQIDPQAFRAHFGPSRPADVPPPPPMTPRADPSRTPQPSRTLQPGHTPQPQLTNTPQNHSYGPGPQGTQQPVATPAGQGEGHEYGPGPQVTGIPGGGGEPQGAQDGLGGNGPGTNASPEPGGTDNGGGDTGGSDNGGGGNGGSDNGSGNSSSGGGTGRP